MMFDIDDKTAANERIHSRYMSVSNQQIDSANSRRKRSQQILLEIISFLILENLNNLGLRKTVFLIHRFEGSRKICLLLLFLLNNFLSASIS